jgi:hypothetical protein
MYSQHALSNHIRLSDSYFATSHSQLYLSHCRDITGDLLHAEPSTECNAQSRPQPLFQGLTLTSVRCQSHPHKPSFILTHRDTAG